MKTLTHTLLGLGLATSLYLLFMHFGMADGHGEEFGICSALFGGSCSDALMSPLSVQLGIPLAGWGVLYYATLLALLLLHRLRGLPEGVNLLSIAWLLSAGAAIAGATLLVIMLVTPGLFCPLCSIVHSINLLLPFLLLRLSGASLRELLNGLPRVGILTAAGSDARFALLLLVLVLLPLSVYQWVRIETVARNTVVYGDSFDPEAELATWDTTRVRTLPVRQDAARVWKAGGAVEMVVFSDFQCPACRMFAHFLQDLRARYEGELSITFRHFPLDAVCNPLVKDSPHPLACEAAVAAEAARSQGAFDAYHDALFAADLTDAGSFDHIAVELGLDMERFRRDRSDPTSRARVDEDVALGIELGLNSTPSVFLNGKLVPKINPRTLKLLIATEVRQARLLNGRVAGHQDGRAQPSLHARDIATTAGATP